MFTDNRLPTNSKLAQPTFGGWYILQTLLAVAAVGWGGLLLTVLLPRLGLIQLPWGSSFLAGLGILELWGWAAFSLTLLVIGRGWQLVVAERKMRLATLPILAES